MRRSDVVRRWFPGVSLAMVALVSGLAVGFAGCGSTQGAGGLRTAPKPRAASKADVAPVGEANAAAEAKQAKAASLKADDVPAGTLPEIQALPRFEAFAELGYLPEWIGYPVLPRGKRVQFLDVFADIVVVQESGNSITVMDAATGANRWTLDMGSDLTKFVGNIRLDNGDIVCASQGEVFVLDAATGVIKAKQKLSVIANTKPVRFNNLLVFGCPTGEVQGHSLTSGYKSWGYMLEGAVTANPVRVSDSAGVVSQNGDVVFLDPANGSARGRGKIFGGLAADPATDGQNMFIAGLDQSIWSFGRQERAPSWRIRTDRPLRLAPIHHDGRVYVAVEGRGLLALEAASGKEIWASQGLMGEVIGVRGGKLLVSEGKGVLSTVDMARGDVLVRVALPNADMLRTDAFVEGNLYAASLKGEVQKFAPKK